MHDKQNRPPTFVGEVREIVGQVFYEHRRSRTRAQMEGAVFVLLVLLVIWLLADRISGTWQNSEPQPAIEQVK